MEAHLADASVLAELGARLARHRLNRNLTQAQLAHEAGVSKSTVERVEAGESSQMTNFIRILRALDLLTGLNQVVPDVPPSPIAQVELQERIRKRASPKSDIPDDEPWQWGDDS